MNELFKKTFFLYVFFSSPFLGALKWSSTYQDQQNFNFETQGRLHHVASVRKQHLPSQNVSLGTSLIAQ